MYQGTLPAVSNRGGWAPIIEVLDDDTGEAVDLSGATIVFEIRDEGCATILSATTANGKITILDTGVFQVAFTANDMRNLFAGSYDIGCTISNADSEPQQFIVATVPVLDGVVQ